MRTVCKHSAPALTHRSHAGRAAGLFSAEKLPPCGLTQRSLWPRQRSQALLLELMLLWLWLLVVLAVVLVLFIRLAWQGRGETRKLRCRLHSSQPTRYHAAQDCSV